MTSVRIYKPSKSAMQSGRGKGQKWILETETTTVRTPENLMGWVSSSDTMNQIKIAFESLEDAVKHAEEKGWEYSVNLPQERKLRPRNYADSFRYVPAEKRT